MQKKSVSVTFTKNRRKSIADPKFELDGESLAYMETMKHLGIVLDTTLRDDSAVKEKIKSYYGAVNSVVARLGGTCSNDSVWMKVTDTQLFPVLSVEYEKLEPYYNSKHRLQERYSKRSWNEV